ncbi:MAG: YlxR family protein [Chloroflexi bacterium]|nr:YlxR family protein [Chloroflexota bacterium]
MALTREGLPERTCIACRRKGPKEEFWRLVRRGDGRIELDLRGRLPGRGAYLCRRGECWRRGLKVKSVAHGLRCPVALEDVEGLFRDLLVLAPNRGSEE